MTQMGRHSRLRQAQRFATILIIRFVADQHFFAAPIPSRRGAAAIVTATIIATCVQDNDLHDHELRQRLERVQQLHVQLEHVRFREQHVLGGGDAQSQRDVGGRDRKSVV